MWAGFRIQCTLSLTLRSPTTARHSTLFTILLKLTFRRRFRSIRSQRRTSDSRGSAAKSSVHVHRKQPCQISKRKASAFIQWLISKIRDDAETWKYWKLKKQRPNRRFLPRSIDYRVAKDVTLDLRTSGTCFHRHEVAYYQFWRAKGCKIINNKRIKNSVGTLWSIILRIDDFRRKTKILFTGKYTYWTFVSKLTYWHFRKSAKNYFLKIELVVIN